MICLYFQRWDAFNLQTSQLNESDDPVNLSREDSKNYKRGGKKKPIANWPITCITPERWG